MIATNTVKASAKEAKNPYEKPNTTENIWKIIKNYPLEDIIKKHFYDVKICTDK